MSQTTTKKAKGNQVIIFSIFIIIGFIMMGSFPIMAGLSRKTILPEKGTLYDLKEAEGIFIRREEVYFSEGSGQLNLFVAEGDKVPVGEEIAGVSLLKDNSRLKQELAEIETNIQQLTSGKAVLPANDADGDTEELSGSIVDELQNNINSGNYSGIRKNTEELKGNNIIGDETLIEVSIESLKQKKESLLNQINNSNLKYYSKTSGMVSFEIDGYENIYLPKEFENYTYDSLSVEKDIIMKGDKSSDEVTPGTPIFKIIDNFQWHIALKVDEKESIENYESGKNITFRIGDNPEIVGRIVNINITEDKAVIIISLNNYLHEYYDLRFSPVTIVKSSRDGLVIPKEVIIEKDGINGVYIKEINGIVKFRPILIIGEEGNNIYIDKGNDKGYININEEDVRTVTLYDEIFKDPSSVTEGKILN